MGLLVESEWESGLADLPVCHRFGGIWPVMYTKPLTRVHLQTKLPYHWWEKGELIVFHKNLLLPLIAGWLDLFTDRLVSL